MEELKNYLCYSRSPGGRTPKYEYFIIKARNEEEAETRMKVHAHFEHSSLLGEINKLLEKLYYYQIHVSGD